jgi:hypothetical protein
LELLRQRLIAPALEADLISLIPAKARRVEGGTFLAFRLRFLVKNTGRVAAYKWQLQVMEISGHPLARADDYRFRPADYPPGWGMDGGMRVDDTILPGCVLQEDKDMGILLRAGSEGNAALQAEIEELLYVRLGMRLATETSPGKLEHVDLRPIVDAQQLVSFVTTSAAAEPTRKFEGH